MTTLQSVGLTDSAVIGEESQVTRRGRNAFVEHRHARGDSPTDAVPRGIQTQTELSAFNSDLPEGVRYNQVSLPLQAFARFINPSRSPYTADPSRKIVEFQKIVGSLIELVDQLAKAAESEKMKAIGARNLLKSIAKQREAQEQQLQALIAEKKMQLERYRIEYETLCKIEADQNEFIDQFIFQK
ncbi:PREDICTED: intraflagellar transport protein 20 homolog [Nipponia nippon]|nr:PREDICTED: intraflagellar transport protein 20 homolog [Nipponia nippon]